MPMSERERVLISKLTARRGVNSAQDFTERLNKERANNARRATFERKKMARGGGAVRPQHGRARNEPVVEELARVVAAQCHAAAQAQAHDPVEASPPLPFRRTVSHDPVEASPPLPFRRTVSPAVQTQAAAQTAEAQAEAEAEAQPQAAAQAAAAQTPQATPGHKGSLAVIRDRLPVISRSVAAAVRSQEAIRTAEATPGQYRITNSRHTGRGAIRDVATWCSSSDKGAVFQAIRDALCHFEDRYTPQSQSGALNKRIIVECAQSLISSREQPNMRQLDVAYKISVIETLSLSKRDKRVLRLCMQSMIVEAEVRVICQSTATRLKLTTAKRRRLAVCPCCAYTLTETCACRTMKEEPPVPGLPLGTVLVFGRLHHTGYYIGAVPAGYVFTGHAVNRVEPTAMQVEMFNPTTNTFRCAVRGCILCVPVLGAMPRCDAEMSQMQFVPLQQLHILASRPVVPVTLWSPPVSTEWGGGVPKPVHRQPDKPVHRQPVHRQVRALVLERSSCCIVCQAMLCLTKSQAIQWNMTQTDGSFKTVMEASHIRAYAFGGPNILVNLVPCCSNCNGAMRCMTPFDFAREQVDAISARRVALDLPPSPNYTKTPAFQKMEKEYDDWYTEWEEQGCPKLVPDKNNWCEHTLAPEYE